MRTGERVSQSVKSETPIRQHDPGVRGCWVVFPGQMDTGRYPFAPNGSHTSSLATSEFTGLTNGIVGKGLPAGEACLAQRELRH